LRKKVTRRFMTEKSGEGVVFTFGRFNPPHVGHELLVNTVLKTARKYGYENRIYASPSQGNAKNPLMYKDKVKYMKKAFGNANVINDPEMKNPFIVAKKLSDEGYKNVVLVVGSDRVRDLDQQIRKYINHPEPKKAFYFDNFEVVSAGGRDPDADDVSGMSASKMRQLASDGNFDKFLEGVPSGMPDRTASMMFDDIRAGLKIFEEVTFLFDRLPIDISEQEFYFAVDSYLSEEAKHALTSGLFEINNEEGDFL